MPNPSQPRRNYEVDFEMADRSVEWAIFARHCDDTEAYLVEAIGWARFALARLAKEFSACPGWAEWGEEAKKRDGVAFFPEGTPALVRELLKAEGVQEFEHIGRYYSSLYWNGLGIVARHLQEVEALASEAAVRFASGRDAAHPAAGEG
ncbi:MAG: hypothetical protein AB1449_12755 [Chloroflexota bacterium]